ncbi:hypothetical protein ACFL6E_04890 [Candidatus Neomarinimicrobiota bacterium]
MKKLKFRLLNKARRHNQDNKLASGAPKSEEKKDAMHTECDLSQGAFRSRQVPWLSIR